MASEQDTEFTELVGFLQAPRADVQKMAVDGVLSYTETQEFLEYCHKNPRKVARPLLRLVEKAEADALAAQSKDGTKTTGELEALEMGSAALQALVNISAVPPVRDEMIGMNVVRRSLDSLKAGWLEGRVPWAHWYAMLIANVTTVRAGQEALANDEALFRFLFSAYVTKARLPAQDGVEDPLRCLGKVVNNVCAYPEGRQLLAANEHGAASLKALAAELADRDRRLDCISTFRNLACDKDCHPALVESGLIEAIACFVYPWDKAADNEREALPEALRKDLEAAGATLTTEVGVRSIAAECLLGFVITEQGRDYLRSSGTAEIIRAWDAEETDTDTKTSLCTVLPAATMAEAELTEHQKKLSLESDTAESA